MFDVQQRILRELKSIQLVIALVLTLCAVLLSTRLLSARRKSSLRVGSKVTSPVPLLPYWIPFVGHSIQFLYSPQTLLNNAKKAFPQGIFALKLGQETHAIVYSGPFIGNGGNDASRPTFTPAGISKRQANAFGFAKKQAQDEALLDALRNVIESHLSTGQNLDELISSFLSNLKENASNLATFSRSGVDQAPWERGSKVSFPPHQESDDVMEANFFSLIRTFTAHMVLPVIVGRAFMENNPKFLEDLWTFTSNFNVLAAGLQRGLPFPGLTAGNIARARLIKSLVSYHRILDLIDANKDVGSEWRDVEDVSEIILNCRKILVEHGSDVRTRASHTLGLLYTLTVKISTTVFWLLLHIYNNPEISTQLHSEIARYAKATQPPQELGIREPPRLAMDVRGLVNNCPLLRACYMETLRLCSNPWPSTRLDKDRDVLMQSEEKESKEDQVFRLYKDEFVDIAYRLHYLDSRPFQSPQQWLPGRYLQDKSNKLVKEEGGSIQDLGVDDGIFDGNEFLAQAVLTLTAAILSIWRIEPPGQKGWKVPAPGIWGSVILPEHDARVWIRMRDLAAI